MFANKMSGFTLVELLLVIGLIAILVSIAVPTAFNARHEARVANARQGVSDVATAVEHFFQEYGRLPDGNDADDIIESLAGEDSNDNPREIPFLNVMEVDDIDWKGEYYDPWDSEYLIYIDNGNSEDNSSAYDRIVGFEGFKVTNELAVVISKGSDRVLHTKDDLLSIPMPGKWVEK